MVMREKKLRKIILFVPYVRALMDYSYIGQGNNPRKSKIYHTMMTSMNERQLSNVIISGYLMIVSITNGNVMNFF